MTAQLSLTEPHPYAVFSECDTHAGCRDDACKFRLYRYLLAWPTRKRNDRVCLFVLANPSTADASKTDPTVSRCIKWAGEWGYGWCYVVNVRAWRATDPKDVPPDPLAIGPDNDAWISTKVAQADIVVCGWGRLAGERGPVVLEIIRSAGKIPHALKLNDDGTPAHPLVRAKLLGPFPMDRHECDGRCGGVFECAHCCRQVGHCMGAYDDIEREHGPICDECASEFIEMEGSTP